MHETDFKTHLLRKRIASLWLILSLSFLWSQVSVAGIDMIDFTQASEQRNWTARNDKVRGGMETSRLMHDGEVGQVSGELSLENNGGFSSINRSVETLSSETDRVELTFVGDGRTYQLRFTTWIDGNKTNYKHNFETIKGEQLKKIFRLNDFQAVFRGRLLNGALELKAQDIKQIGFLIADKKPLTFELNLLQIQFKTSQETE